MAIVTIPGVLWLPSPKANQIGSLPSFATNMTIDAFNEAGAFIIRIPKTGNISKVLWATRTVTTGSTVTIRGETLDETTSPSQPSGTLYHANFTGTQVVQTTDDNTAFLTSLSAAVAVTRGDKIAILVKHTDNNTNAMQVATFADDLQDFPYCMLFTSSWAALSGGQPVLGLEYDDGSYVPIAGCYPFHAITATTFGTTSTPDEIGLRFKLPFPFRISEWWAWLDADANFNVNLYDSDGVTKRAGGAYAVDKDTRRSAGADVQMHPFLSTFDCLANTYYRLVIEPLFDSLTIYDYTVNTAAAMDATDGGQDFHYTSAKNPAAEGDWTQVLTRRPFMGIGISGLDNGASGGGPLPSGLIIQNIGTY